MAHYNPVIVSWRLKARRMPISHSSRERVDRSRKRKYNQIQLLVEQRRWNGKRGSVPENSETHAAQVGLIYFTWWDISSRGGGFYITRVRGIYVSPPFLSVWYMNYEGTIFVTTRKGPTKKERRNREKERKRRLRASMYKGPRKEEENWRKEKIAKGDLKDGRLHEKQIGWTTIGCLTIVLNKIPVYLFNRSANEKNCGMN